MKIFFNELAEECSKELTSIDMDFLATHGQMLDDQLQHIQDLYGNREVAHMLVTYGEGVDLDNCTQFENLSPKQLMAVTYTLKPLEG